MATWIVFLIIAIIFFLVELYTPTMFFLNFSVAAVVCAVLGLFTDNYDVLIPIFVILSIIFIIFLRPLLNINPAKEKEHNFESQYIGQKGIALCDISEFSGRIQVYDEAWKARTENEEAPTIEKGATVVIKHHNDLTMVVAQVAPASATKTSKKPTPKSSKERKK